MPRLPSPCLYLVTDSDLLCKSATSFEGHVEQAILGGVNVVQLREKEASTRELLEKARRLQVICKKYNVPLIINDRIDVALAIGADGVHVGQDDMNCTDVRKILGEGVLIGVSVNNEQEAKAAVAAGADYLGIGAVYDTQTKALTKPTMGPSGVRQVLEYLATVSRPVDTVAIGGINAGNIEHVMLASSISDRVRLDGVAVVSAIMTSSEPAGVSRGLRGLLTSTPAYCTPQIDLPDPMSEVDRILALVARIRQKRPLIQHMTNNVVKNFSANVSIAVGASPAMSEVRDEVEDFARVNGALLVNMGMVSSIETSIHAVQANNRLGKPCVLDPVAAGASTYRRAATKEYLDNGYFDVIKGNEAEVRASAGFPAEQRGVDNISSSNIEDRADLACILAKECHNIVVITGVEDIISNGAETCVVRCGHAWLGEITGSGCSLGSVIASALAVNVDDKFWATIAALVLYGLAAEHAAQKDCVVGPGSFVPAFIDSLYALSSDDDLFRREIQARSSIIERL